MEVPDTPNLVPGAPSKETGYEVAEHLVLRCLVKFGIRPNFILLEN